MKEFLIGIGMGFVVGALMVKSNKDFSKAVDKSKQMVGEKVEQGKEFIEEKIIQPKKKNSSTKNN